MRDSDQLFYGMVAGIIVGLAIVTCLEVFLK